MNARAAFLVLISALPLAAPVRGQEPKTSVRDVVMLSGKVERMDKFSRSLTLRLADNVTQILYVPPDLKVFDDLKTGDLVSARVQESVIVALRPDLKPTAVTDTTAEAKKSGSEPAEVLQQLKAVVTIESADPRTGMVAYKAGNGMRVVRAVADPRLIEGLKPGDVIEITYTRLRAIELERKR